MRIITLAALASGCLVGAPALAAGEFVGVWDVTIQSPQGVREATWTVTEADGEYGIEIDQQAPQGGPGGGQPPAPAPITDITFDGTTYSFTRNITGPQGSMEIVNSGMIDGDTLKGTVSVGQFGEFEVTGARQ